MKKILYIWQKEYPWEVRVEKFCRSLIENDYQITILSRCFAGQKKTEEVNGIKIIRVGCDQPWSSSVPISINPVWKKAIIDAVSLEKPDIIMPREIMLAEAAGKIGKKYGIPVIMDMAENYPAVMKGWRKYYDNLINRILVHYLNIPELVEKRAVRLMDGIITVCQEQNDRLCNIYNYPENKLEIVHNTPDIYNFQGVRKGADVPPKIFAYHGFINSERNLDKLIIGFDIAAKENSFIHLVIAGDGEELQTLKNLAAKLDSSDRIIFKGRYNFNDLKDLYSEMDVGILPYRIDEHINHTISNKLFDYIAAGKPVIVSMAKPMIRIINETNAGKYADCNNPENIAEAIKEISAENLTDLSRNGLDFAESKYNWDIDLKRLTEFLKKYL